MSDEPPSAPASQSHWRILITLFGLGMFAIGLIIGNLILPGLFNLGGGADVTPTPRATVVAALPPTIAATATPVPSTATPVPPTATTIPPSATPVPPTSTALPPMATPTIAPTPTAARSPSSVFAPDPTEQPAVGPTGTVSPTITATGTEAAPTAPIATVAAPTATATLAFVATDRINTELPVNFRAGPGTTFAAQGALQPGTLLAATGAQQTTDGVLWRQFRIASGTIGWIRAQDVIAI